MFEATETIFRESLSEAIEQTLLTDPSADRETVVTELAMRWNFSAGDYLEGDACYIDADCADAILQIAMFGELVFG